MKIRPARIEDMKAIRRFERIGQSDLGRFEYVEEAIKNEQAWSITSDERIIGYMIINNSFFSRRFLALIYIDETFRDHGFGRQALKWCKENIGESFFTSTNLSNSRMIHLLRTEGFSDSGIIYNLDEGDPEVIFFYDQTPA